MHIIFFINNYHASTLIYSFKFYYDIKLLIFVTLQPIQSMNYFYIFISYLICLHKKEISLKKSIMIN